ncbi:hypothetical protein BJX70DRAFT_108398 [Aspergillus crustosus]
MTTFPSTTQLSPIYYPSTIPSTINDTPFKMPDQAAYAAHYVYCGSWTTDPAFLNDGEWDGEDSEGQIRARSHGLPTVRPIICQGDYGVAIVEAEGKFYVINQETDECDVILTPNTEEGILELLKSNQDVKEFRTKRFS